MAIVTRKEKLGKKIESDIIRILEGSEIPVSTRDIAVRIGRAWHSVQGHCLKLQIQEKINGIRISNLNAWTINKAMKKEKR